MMGDTKIGGLSDAELEALLGDGDDGDAGGASGAGSGASDDSGDGAASGAEGDGVGSGDGNADGGTDSSDDDSEEFPDREAFLASLSPAQRKHYDAALDKANGNARRYREKLKSGAAPSPADMPAKTPAAGDVKADAPVDVEAVKAQLRAELEAEFNSKREADQAAVEATRQLVAAGLQLPEEPKKRTAALRKALKLIDLDSADPDDVELAVSELQDTMPSLFGAKSSSRRTGKVGGPTSTQATKAKNPIEALFD